MIEENNSLITDETLENDVKIYSKKAIWGFSLFFAPIFGGFLLRQNLIDIKKKKEANMVLLYSIAFTFLTILIVSGKENTTRSLPYLLNMIWGAILSEYFYIKYFPNENYKYKKIWKALIISIIITIPFVLAMIYAPTE